MSFKPSTEFNPFVQGWNLTPSESSTFGALPLGLESLVNPRTTHYVTYLFVEPSPNILQSKVVRPGTQTQSGQISPPHFYVVTDGEGSIPGYTTLKSADRRNVALIEWGRTATSLPFVEIRGVLPKMLVRDWLHIDVSRLTGRTIRNMEVCGMRFVWMSHSDSLHLYPATPNSQPCVIVQKEGQIVTVLFSPEALKAGLVESCIVAVVLLLSGRKLE